MDTKSSLLPLLFEFGRMVRCRMRAKERLTLPQLEMLHFVYDNGSPSMRLVARHLRIQAPTATTLAADLVKLRLIERKPDPRDRRRIHLVLTSKGERVFKESLCKRGEVIAALFKEIQAEDQREFERILEKIISTNRA